MKNRADATMVWVELEPKQLLFQAPPQIERAPTLKPVDAPRPQVTTVPHQWYYRKREAKSAWEEFLTGLGGDGSQASPQAATSARAFWAVLRRQMDVRVPQAGVGEDGTVQFAWDVDEHHIDVDFLSSGGIEWFYRNRQTGKVATGEADKPTPLPKELLKHLKVLKALFRR